jgi:HEPN domain-containing protein
MNPPSKKSQISSPQDWLTHAQSDLKMAKLGREDGEILFEQVCFHAQQTVEKAMKAVLLERQVDFPLTHDLELLLDIGKKAGIIISENLLDIDTLTPYAVETRYPGYLEAIAEEDVTEAIKLAENFLAWAKDQLRL